MLYQRVNKDCFYFRGVLVDLGDVEQWIAFGKIGFLKEHEGSMWLNALRRHVVTLEKMRDRDSVQGAIRGIGAALFHLNHHGYLVDSNITGNIPKDEIIAYCDEVFPE